MYGLVNRAIEDLVVERHGAEIWDHIRDISGVTEEVFISSKSYDDSVTYGLVQGASKVLGMAEADILRLFGEHWILRAAHDSYGLLLEANGRTLPEFLKNLPSFHTRVLLIFPKLQPPSFRVSDETENSLHLHYYSKRKGLTPFVLGLLEGLGKKYKTAVQTEILASRDRGDDHEVFRVRWA